MLILSVLFYLFFLLLLLIPYKSVETMMVYFFSIIKQFNDGKQGYLTQFKRLIEIIFFIIQNVVFYKLLSLNEWIQLSKYEPDINQTDIRSSRKFLHHTDEK